MADKIQLEYFKERLNEIEKVLKETPLLNKSKNSNFFTPQSQNT
jgi:hypothetical protein